MVAAEPLRGGRTREEVEDQASSSNASAEDSPRVLRSDRTLFRVAVAGAPIAISAIRNGMLDWQPSADAAITAVRTNDVFSAHPPLIGLPAFPSVGSTIEYRYLGAPVNYLLAVPVRLFGVTWGIVLGMGILNTLWFVLAMWLIRRRVGYRTGVSAILQPVDSGWMLRYFHGMWPVAMFLWLSVVIGFARSGWLTPLRGRLRSVRSVPSLAAALCLVFTGLSVPVVEMGTATTQSSMPIARKVRRGVVQGVPPGSPVLVTYRNDAWPFVSNALLGPQETAVEFRFTNPWVIRTYGDDRAFAPGAGPSPRELLISDSISATRSCPLRSGRTPPLLDLIDVPGLSQRQKQAWLGDQATLLTGDSVFV